jgi:hypothetical protein
MLALLLLFVSLTSAVQEAGYLDLVNQTTQPRRTEPSTASASVVGVGVGDRPATQPRLPLELTISDIEGAEHKLGDDLIYTIRIENMSARAIQIPWTPSLRDIEPARPGPYAYQMARLAPMLINSSGQIELLEPAAVYGSGEASTMLELAPRQWARITAKSRISARGPNLGRFLSTGRHSVSVGATWSLYRVSFSERNGGYHESFMPADQEYRSTNTIPFHLESGSDR